MSRTRGLAPDSSRIFDRTSTMQPASERPDGADDTDTTVGPAPRRTASGFVEELRGGAGGARLIEVPLDERLVDGPRNPRDPKKIETDLDGLAASISSRGLLQPLVVTPADAWREAHPQRPLPDAAEWVLIAGHRRRRAGLRAAKATLPAVVRPEAPGAGEGLIEHIFENGQRLDLSPLEEARSFQLLVDLYGMSQRAISAETGFAQSTVSKRLALLTFPQAVQDAIEDGLVGVLEVMDVLRRDLHTADEQVRAVELMRRDGLEMTQAVRHVRRDVGGAEQSEGADGATGGELSSDAGGVVASTAGGGPGVATSTEHAKRVDSPQETETVTPGPPPATGAPSNDDEVPFRGVVGQMPPGSTDTKATPGQEQPRAEADEAAPDEAPPIDDDLDEHELALEARAEACRTAVRGTMNNREVLDVLVDVSVSPPRARPRPALSTALKWLGISDGGDPETVLERLLDADRRTAQRVAVAAALARRELDLRDHRWAHEPWPSDARRHVQRLIALGAHSESDWERAKLAGAPQDHEDADATSEQLPT